MRHRRLDGPFHRVADPSWEDPLDGRHSQKAGGRWNPPGSFPVVYLCREIAVARANVYRLLVGLPYGPEDLDPELAPVLIEVAVPMESYVDAFTKAGLRSLGLPDTYPLDRRGALVEWQECRPVGLRAWEAGEPGLAARSAARPDGGMELAWFRSRRRLRQSHRRTFDEWFW